MHNDAELYIGFRIKSELVQHDVVGKLIIKRGQVFIGGSAVAEKADQEGKEKISGLLFVYNLMQAKQARPQVQRKGFKKQGLGWQPPTLLFLLTIAPAFSARHKKSDQRTVFRVVLPECCPLIAKILRSNTKHSHLSPNRNDHIASWMRPAGYAPLV